MPLRRGYVRALNALGDYPFNFGWLCGWPVDDGNNKPMKTNPDQIQQGDVLLRRVKKPKNAKIIKNNQPVTVALGEATGHHHTFGGQATLLEAPGEFSGVWTNNYVIPSEEPMIHQEHGPVTASRDIWQVGQVRELDWLKQMERKVVD